MLTNLEPDHLDRHGTFDAYAATKLRVFEHQGAGRRRRRAARLRAGARARRVGSSSRQTTRCRPSRSSPAPTTARTPPRRPPQRGRPASRTSAIAEALATFPGVEHRIEELATVDGVRYVNDSKATNVAAALRALASFPGRRKHVILGGRGKAEPYDAARSGLRAGRPRLPDRRGAPRARAPPWRGRRALRASRTPRRAVAACRVGGARRRRRPPLAGLCEVRPVHELRAARGGVPPAGAEAPGWKAVPTRPARTAPPGPRDARARRVRARDGVQRHVGVGGARRRRPDEVPRQAGPLRRRGLVLLAALSRVDYHRLRPLAPILLVGALVACVAVLVVAPPINGARRWFLARARELPAVRVREARGLRLALRPARAPPDAADDGRADEAGRPRRRARSGR